MPEVGFPLSNQSLSAAELDRRLEEAVRQHERAEKLVCFYLNQIKRRAVYKDFGFANVYDYALERFGFAHRKTRALITLGRQLNRLEQIARAMTEGRFGWSKASLVARVATKETEEEWVEAASALSFRELERKIRDDLSPGGGTVSMWLSDEQTAVWARALEICRRMAGEELEPGRCLELIAGEFLATYEHMMQMESPKDDDDDGDVPGLVESEAALSEEEVADAAREPETTEDLMMCPDEDGLPSPAVTSYQKIHRHVLGRDRYRCQYPGCSAMSCLHVHHIEFRSRFGSKGKKDSSRCHHPSNLTALCVVHHKMVHAGTIGVKGKAPGELEWRRPPLMESAMQFVESKIDILERFEPDDFETAESEAEPVSSTTF
jgi:hypothetical protein